MIYTKEGETIAEVELVAGEDVPKISFGKYLVNIIKSIFG